MLKLVRALSILGLIFAATLVMSPWRLGEKSLHSHMSGIVEKTGTEMLVSRSQSAFESYGDKLRTKIPEAFTDIRRKLAAWINPTSSNLDPNKQD